MSDDLYDTDILRWSEQQAKLLGEMPRPVLLAGEHFGDGRF